MQGKSFLVAVFCCARCILYPGTSIILCGGTKGQSINILQKIQNELIPKSPQLKTEISYLTTSLNNAECRFYNGSRVKVVTASDTARGNRAHIVICDEFRMIPEDIVDTVIRRFNGPPRHPGYLDDPKYKHLQERNKEVYLSSAYFKNHWCYQKFMSYFKNLVDDKKRYFCCGLPYQLSIKEGLYMAEQALDEMSETNFSDIRWSINFFCAP